MPVLPVDAEISETSSLNRKGAAGKAVGVRGWSGAWHGFDWVKHECDEADLARWHAMGADIGIKGGPMPDGTWLVWIDADTLVEQWATLIEGHVNMLAPLHADLPKRVGRAPKAAYPIRVSGEIAYARIDFGGTPEKPERVELLSEGRYAKVEGLHPETGAPYSWPRPLVPYDELPVITPERLMQFLEDLRPLLPASSAVKTSGASVAVNQESLRGDPELVRKAVALIPNTSERFPTRESYLHVGYAIKAALPDDEPTALALYEDWCGRWSDGENDPEVVASDWRRMKPPFRIGAPLLFELAEGAAPGQFTKADRWFDHVAGAAAAVDGQVVAASAEIDWFSPVDWEGVPEKPAEWLLKGWIPHGHVSLLYGDGGIGKTLAAQQLATAMAAGKDFLGLPTLSNSVEH
ncbi:hypothetical protein ASG59_08825 [Methylobacterium sp. Leaf466]|nr:hypothetical protein ASG59_08825 [Methylobacterium sp. Leaf466]